MVFPLRQPISLNLNMVFALRPLLLSIFVYSLFMACVQAKVHHHKWEISYQFKSPDCLKKLAVTINGQTPGPIIYATEGDTVVVEVKNGLLTENLAIHWHGIRQIDTPWVEGATQWPILPGDKFAYRFMVDRAGTYIYHAHYGKQRSAGLNGMIIVRVPEGFKEPFTYDSEHSILLNDWWHSSTYEEDASLALPGKQFTCVGQPHAYSLLINGRGSWFNCPLAVNGTCNATNPQCAPYMLTVVPGKTYRLRVASVTLLALNFEIEGHSLTVVQDDGNYVDPSLVKNLNINYGETYSVILKADQDPTRNYWLASNVVGRIQAITPTGIGLLNYYGIPRGELPPTAPPIGPLSDVTWPTLAQPSETEGVGVDIISVKITVNNLLNLAASAYISVQVYVAICIKKIKIEIFLN